MRGKGDLVEQLLNMSHFYCPLFSDDFDGGSKLVVVNMNNSFKSNVT